MTPRTCSGLRARVASPTWSSTRCTPGSGVGMACGQVQMRCSAASRRTRAWMRGSETFASSMSLSKPSRGALRSSGEVARTIVISFDSAILESLRKIEPTLMTGLLFEGQVENPIGSSYIERGHNFMSVAQLDLANYQVAADVRQPPVLAARPN